jgi:hypothetical protein
MGTDRPISQLEYDRSDLAHDDTYDQDFLHSGGRYNRSYSVFKPEKIFHGASIFKAEAGLHMDPDRVEYYRREFGLPDTEVRAMSCNPAMQTCHLQRLTISMPSRSFKVTSSVLIRQARAWGHFWRRCGFCRIDFVGSSGTPRVLV